MLAIPLLLAQGSGCCGPGTFRHGAGCDDCPVGSSCPGGFVDPTPCAAGSFAAVGGLALCISCAGGTYQNDTGATGCRDCSPGHYCPKGAVAPLQCEKGTFSDKTNLDSAGGCDDCPPGYACTTGSVVPVICRAGRFAAGSRNAECEPCEAGSYQSDTGAAGCRECNPGSFCPVGASLELPAQCEPGTYGNVTDSDGLPDCFDCPAGSSCLGGGLPPRQCAAGTIAPFGRMDACDKCPAGEYQDGGGATACKACLQGSYCPAGAAAPLPCEAGSYSNRTDLEDASQCTFAEKGYYATTGSSKPTPCSPGTFAATEGLSECDSCEPGSSGAGGAFCSKCAAGTYAANPGQGECIPCPHPLSSRGGGVTCSICKAGYYLQDASILPVAIFESPTECCKPCPPNADCSSPNTTLEALGVPRGYWRASNQTTELHKCVASEHCSGSGSAANVERSRRRLEYGDVGADALAGAGCDAGHTGPLCEWCVSDEQYFSRKEGGCADCPTVGRFGIVAAALVALAGTIFLSYRALGRIAGKARLEAIESRVGFQPKLKIVVSFYQVATTLGPVYGARLHEDFYGWMSFLEFFSFDLLGLTYPDACIGSMSHRLLLAALWPFAVILLGSAAFAAYALTVWLLRRKSGSGGGGGRKLVRETQSRILYLAILVAYFVLPSVSRSIFKARMCESFGISVFDPTARRSYLVADLDVLCRSDDEMYRGLDAYFWAFFVLWPVLVPLVLLCLLLWIRRDVRALRVTRLSRACRFLWRDYNAGCHYWELADMYRKLFLASLVLFIQTDDGSSKLLRLIVASVTSTLFLTNLALVKPFKRFDDFYLACTANLLLTCCFVLGTVVQICESAAYEDMCETLVGFPRFGLSAFVIGLSVTTIANLLLLAFIGVKAAKDRRTEQSLLAEANKALADAALEMQGAQCTFVFIDAEVIRSGQYEEAGYSTLPRLQDVEADHPEWVHKRLLQRHLAYGRHEYRDNILAVSHRWEQPDAPDASGAHITAVREHLQSSPNIELVWYDYWCMPQGSRTPTEKINFKRMLMNVNILYIGSSVLILQELSYMSRFWTQFEAWCSMQEASIEGLRPAPAARRRCTVVPILQATEGMAAELIRMWAGRSVDQAIETLASPDVTVTNQSDKELQLYKLRELDSLVVEAAQQCTTTSNHDASRQITV